MNSITSLKSWGWQPFFQQQLSLDEFEHGAIARIIAHHRGEYIVQTARHTVPLAITPSLPPMVLGDWLLLDDAFRFNRLLTRKSLFRRKAAGTKVNEQLIAANVDTLLIVCSLNHDFNLSRIERFLALAHDAEVEPVVVLTKQDLCPDPAHYSHRVESLDHSVSVIAINARDRDSCDALAGWCQPGQTLSLLGSSGVGKSTLINTLLGHTVQHTGDIREDDSKGRHTTTARSMHPMPSGAVFIDTPGMRELQLVDCEQGISQTFADIEMLAQQCRFGDCQHQHEPGCAVRQAVDRGELEPRRLTNYIKLLKEQARNSASLAERRARDKQFGKMVKAIVSDSHRHKTK